MMLTPQNSPLIEAAELKSVIDSPELILLDASIPPIGSAVVAVHKWPEYTIASAQYFDIEGAFSDTTSQFPHTMPSAKQFQQQARLLGINANSQIVVYDDLGMFSSARAWWMFKAMGHNNISVLNGGLPRWMSEQYPTTPTTISMTHLQGDFTAVPQKNYFCDYFSVGDALKSETIKVLDARGRERFSGRAQEPRLGVRSGHMPNSLNLPYTELLNDGRLLPQAELHKILYEIVSKDDALIMTCGSGITACILALAADICGFKDICVYDGSWCEWGSQNHLAVIAES